MVALRLTAGLDAQMIEASGKVFISEASSSLDAARINRITGLPNGELTMSKGIYASHFQPM